MEISDIMTVAEARARGTSLSRLRGPGGHRHLYGIYGPLIGTGGETASHQSLLRAATAGPLRQLAQSEIAPFEESPHPQTPVRASDVASHESAAYLWGFPDIPRPKTLQLLSVSGDRRRRTQGMSGFRGLVLPEETTMVDGVPVTTPARTWLDLARASGVMRLILWADWLFNPVWGGDWDREPLSTPEELRALLERHRGKPGIRKARLAAERARVGSDSPKETQLRLALVDAGLPEPAVNQWIYDPVTGERLHRGDLTYDEVRIDLEYEGEHHSEEGQVQRDIARSERLQRADWLELRFSSRHARNDWLPAIHKTREALLSRGWRP